MRRLQRVELDRIAILYSSDFLLDVVYCVRCFDTNRPERAIAAISVHFRCSSNTIRKVEIVYKMEMDS